MVCYLGRILLCTGPHLGLCYDGHIWQRTGASLLRCWERFLGDGAYCANAQFITPYRKPANGELAIRESTANADISFHRARVEHTNHLFESHAIFQGAFRGSVALLDDVVKVTAHTTNIHLRTHPRYAAVGPWPHTMDGY